MTGILTRLRSILTGASGAALTGALDVLSDPGASAGLGMASVTAAPQAIVPSIPNRMERL